MTNSDTHTALITGASEGLGLALAHGLVDRGSQVIIDARTSDTLRQAAAGLGASVTAIRGDVADPDHREDLARAVGETGRLDLLVNNASTVGASPMPSLDEITPVTLGHTYVVNVFAPLALTQLLLPHLVATSGTVVNITSDAAVEPYAGWGAYGPSKAALEHATAILAAEQPSITALSVDPGDMNTRMHAEAEPGEDLSGLPQPASVVPALLRLIDEPPHGTRHRAADVALLQEA